MSEVLRRTGGGVLAGLLATRGGIRELRLLAVAQIAPLPIQIGLTLFTAFVLTPAERGSAVFVVGAGAIGASVLFGSFHVGAVAALKAGDRAAFRRVCICVLGLASTFAAAAAAVMVAGVSGPALYTARNLVLIFTGLAMYVVLLNASRTIQGLGASGGYSSVNISLSAAYAVGVAITLGPLGQRDASAVTTPWLLSVAVALVVAVGLLARALRRDRTRTDGIVKQTDVQSVRASISAHGGSVSQQLAYRADLFLLGALSTAALVSVYTLAVSLAELVWVVPEIIALSVFADDDVRSGSDWRVQLHRRLRAVFVVTAGVALVLIAGAALLLLVLLPDYRTSLLLLLILLPGMVFASGTRVILSALTARDERLLLIRASVGTLALILLYVPAISWFDVVGAAVISPVIYLGQWLLLRRLLARAA